MLSFEQVISRFQAHRVPPLVARLALGGSLASLILAAPTLAIAGPIDLPSGGPSVTIDGGSTETATDVIVGNGGTADLTVTGAGTTLDATGNVTVGTDAGDGTLTLSDGATLNDSGWLVVGSGIGSVGNMTVTGAGTSFSGGTNIAVGDYGGKGSLTINNGAAFDLPNGSIYVGAHGGDGKLLIDGAGTVVSVDGNMSTGCTQTTTDCRVDITNGAKLLMTGDQTGGFVSTGPAQNGTVRLSGAGTEWSGIRWFYVGYNQDADESPNIGTLIVENGAVARRDKVIDPTTMPASVGSFAAGVSPEDTGNVIVRGAGSELSSIYNMYVNFSGTGNFEVYDGGKIAAGATTPINNSGTLANVLAGLRFYSDKGTVNIGGTVDGPARSAGFIDAENIIFRTPVDGLSGGTLVLNHTNSDYEISSNLLSFGSTLLVPPVDVGLGITERGGKIVSVAGDTTFSGDGDGFYGLLDLRGGTVRIDGSLGPLSQSIVGDGGLLTGTGSVGSVTVKSGGWIGGGDRSQVGTLGLGGDLAVEDGGNVRVRFDPQSQNDLLTITGDADFSDGSKLSVETLQDGRIDLSKRHLVMSIDGDRTGKLTGGSGMVLSNFYGLAIAYEQSDPGAKTLVYLDPTQLKSYADVAGITRNQRAVANTLQGMKVDNPVVNAVAMLPDDASAASAYDQLSGVVFADVPLAVTDELTSVSDTMIGKAHESVSNRGASLWVSAIGRQSTFADDGNAPDATTGAYGLLSGIDIAQASGIKFGGAIGVIDGRTDLGNAYGDVSTNTFHGGAYAGFTTSGITLLAGGNVSTGSMSSNRDVSFGDYSDHLEDDTTLSGGQIFAEVAYKALGSDKVFAEPFLRYSHLVTGSVDISETGGAAALNGEIEQASLDFGTVGVRFGVEPSADAQWGLNGNAGYRRLLSGEAGSTSVEMEGSATFTSEGSRPPTDVGFVDVGLEASLSEAASVRLNYSGSYGQDYLSHSVGAVVSWKL